MISLTSLLIIEDEALHPNEVRVHPGMANAIRSLFLKTDISRSLQQFPRLVNSEDEGSAA